MIEASKNEGGKKQLDDIFAETDKTASAVETSAKASQSVPSQPSPYVEPEEPKNWFRFFTIITIAILIVGGIVSAIIFRKAIVNSIKSVFTKIEKKAEKPEVNNNQIENINQIEPTNNQEEVITPIQNTTPPPPKINTNDTDSDGLTNDEEAELGTSPNSADSDGDGLFDREEVKVWKTNPMNPDTDGDGHIDGDEVKMKFNPRGEGKLSDMK